MRTLCCQILREKGVNRRKSMLAESATKREKFRARYVSGTVFKTAKRRQREDEMSDLGGAFVPYAVKFEGEGRE